MWNVVVFLNKDGGSRETTKVTGGKDPFNLLTELSGKNPDKKCVLFGDDRVRQSMKNGKVLRNVEELSVYVDEPSKEAQADWKAGK